MELVTEFLTGGATPPPSPHQVYAEIQSDIAALKNRHRDIPAQQDLIGKILEAAGPVAELGMNAFEMLTDFFGGGTTLTPARMQAAIDERKKLRREAAAEDRPD